MQDELCLLMRETVGLRLRCMPRWQKWIAIKKYKGAKKIVQNEIKFKYYKHCLFKKSYKMYEINWKLRA